MLDRDENLYIQRQLPTLPSVRFSFCFRQIGKEGLAVNQATLCTAEGGEYFDEECRAFFPNGSHS